MPAESEPYVSRGGIKLAGALDAFGLCVTGLICGDFGSHVGGFVDCLLRRGAIRVHSVDTCYGTLAWTLRKDERVVVLERTNAMHVRLSEPVDLLTIDAGWTRQQRILPNARNQLRPGGHVVTLIKPHYEAPKELLRGGVLPDDQVAGVLEEVCAAIASLGYRVLDRCPSPIRGHGGNEEYFALLSLAENAGDSPSGAALRGRQGTPTGTRPRPSDLGTGFPGPLGGVYCVANRPRNCGRTETDRARP